MVHLWIINDKNEVLLMKENNNSTWGCLCGYVYYNESSLDSVVRLAKEKLGLDIDVENVFKLKIERKKHDKKEIDVFVLKANFDLQNLKNNQINFKYVSEAEYFDLCKKHEVHENQSYFFNTYQKNKNEGVLIPQNKIFISNKNKNKYLKGNLHTHTTDSDGKYTTEEVEKFIEKMDMTF